MDTKMSHLVACSGFSAMSRKTCRVTKLIKCDQGLPKKLLACSEQIGKTRLNISFLIDCISIKSSDVLYE